jgi:tetratricopeptide (TPR) repeat protein
VACRAGDDPAAALEHAGEAVRAAEELDRLEPSPETVAMLVQALEERSRSQAAAGDAAKAVADLVRVTELLAPARDASPAGAVAWSRAQRELAIAAFEAGDDARAVAAIEAAEATLGPVAESDKSPETQAAWTDVLRVRTEIAVALDDVATAERVLERRRGLKSLSTDETADQALTWAELARREGDPDDVRARRAARAVELGRSAIEAGVSPEAEQADERWGWLRALVLTAAPSPAGSP